MARKCPDCGHINDNEMSFCTECGEPLDPQVRLVMELEGKKVTKASTQPVEYKHDDDDDDDDYASLYHEEEKKKSPIGWIIGLAVVAAAVWFLFFR